MRKRSNPPTKDWDGIIYPEESKLDQSKVLASMMTTSHPKKKSNYEICEEDYHELKRRYGLLDESIVDPKFQGKSPQHTNMHKLGLSGYKKIGNDSPSGVTASAEAITLRNGSPRQRS